MRQLAMWMFAATLLAEEVDEKLLRLIGEDATVVYGVNAVRYRASKLQELNPVGERELEGVVTELRAVFVVACRERCEAPLTIFRGSVAKTDEESRVYRGVRIWDGDRTLALLDANTGVIGDFGQVGAAIDRWFDGAAPGEIGDPVRKASGAFDSWIVAIKPLERVRERGQQEPSSHWEKMAKVVSRVRGGIRLGATIDVSAEADTETPDDAMGLAAIVRWAPGFI